LEDIFMACLIRRVSVRRFAIAACVVSAALLVAGCGAPAASQSGVATLDPNASAAASAGASARPADAREAALAFSRCMREHGVANFPDPQFPDGGGMTMTIGPGDGIDPNSPTMQAAHNACESLLPKGPESGVGPSKEDYDRALEFAQCIRAHGVPDFPDPQMSGGGMTVQANGAENGGTDPNSPTMQSAMQACQALLPGGSLEFGSSGRRP
jgi:hypothetical protein